MLLSDILGYLAAFCTTIAFLPQTIQVIRTKDTEALSLSMYSIFTVGVVFWLCYGITKKDYAIIIANAITTVLSAIILIMKIKTTFTLKKNQSKQHTNQ